MSEQKPLKVAVCLFNDVTALDYQGPIEILGFLAPTNLERRNYSGDASHTLEFSYLASTDEPIRSVSGPLVVPECTYKAEMEKNTQYDILLIPGGPGSRPESVPRSLQAFITHQAPGAKYILTVCTGSWILAGTGLLDGKRATTNKAAFKDCKSNTSDKIQWVTKARWVVDGNIWTSSGVTAGMDMANAFLVHLAGEDFAKWMRGIIELRAREEDEDEFAEYHGLI